MSTTRDRITEALTAAGYRPATHEGIADALMPLLDRIAKEGVRVNDLPDYSDAVKVLDEALTELQVVEDIDQAWSLLDYLSQQGWDLVRRDQ